MADTLTWAPALAQRGGARYRAIADALAEDIDAGRLAPGTRLPTHRALARALDVTVGTVTRAYAEAERRGLVEATVGRGTYVRGDVANWHRPTGHKAARSTPWPPTLAAEEAESGPIDLSVNYPARSYVTEALQEALRSLDLDPRRLDALGGYQASAGRPDHRAAGARWLAQLGLPEADAEQVIPVHGAQGGLWATAAALLRPGDALLVETLTWPGVQSLARQNGLRLVQVAGDGEGMDPDALAETARRSGARLAYCIPTLHNPSNVTMPAGRRDALLEVARQHDLILLEDDVYGFLADRPPAPLAARDPQRAIYVTSLSKCVAPALRLGYVLAPPALAAKVAQAVAASTLMVSPLLAEAAAALIDGGQARAAAQAQRQEAQARQARAAELLGRREPAGADAAFHLWLALPEPWSAAGFTAEALARGVALTPGTAFCPDGRDPRAVRLCLSAVPERADLERALVVVRTLMQERPDAAMPMV